MVTVCLQWGLGLKCLLHGEKEVLSFLALPTGAHVFCHMIRHSKQLHEDMNVEVCAGLGQYLAP